MWYRNLNPVTSPSYNIYVIIDDFKLALFCMNLLLTVVILT